MWDNDTHTSPRFNQPVSQSKAKLIQRHQELAAGVRNYQTTLVEDALKNLPKLIEATEQHRCLKGKYKVF